MRMNDQQEMSMVVRKPSRGASTTRPCSVSLGEKAIEWTSEIELAPVLADALEHRLDLPGIAARRAA